MRGPVITDVTAGATQYAIPQRSSPVVWCADGTGWSSLQVKPQLVLPQGCCPIWLSRQAATRLATEIAACRPPGRWRPGYRLSSTRLATSESVNRSRRPVIPFMAVTPHR